MPPLLSTGLRVLGVAATACAASAVSFYIWLAIAIGGRQTFSPRIYEWILLGTTVVGGAATLSALSPKHRLTLGLLGLDGVLMLGSIATGQVDAMLEPRRRQAENLAHQDRIVNQLSVDVLMCSNGFEVHRLQESHLALTYFQVGNSDLPVQYLAYWESSAQNCELYVNEFMLTHNNLPSCTNAQGERFEDWLLALRDESCPNP